MTIHIGLIGAGIGAQHLQAYHQLRASFTVTAICDLDVEKLNSCVAGRISQLPQIMLKFWQMMRLIW